MTTEECKAAIVRSAEKEVERIKALFEPPLTEAQVQKTLKVANWKREIKRKEDGVWIREFDCRPLDGQLRAYVAENGQGEYSVHIQGE